jgi:hypothetical protein
VAEPALPVKVTFAPVAEGSDGFFAWQGKRVRPGKIKPKTVHDYRRTYAQHLDECIGRDDTDWAPRHHDAPDPGDGTGR